MKRLIHLARMAYGGLCHAVWMALPDRLAFGTVLGDHLLAWAGYWANMKKRELSLKCLIAHWLACRIDWLERKGARFNNRFRGTFQHQADLGPLSMCKLWLGKYWTREYIDKRCNRW